MNMISFSVSTDELKAALLFASKDDSRYVLKCVQFIASAGKLKLVATNGRCIGIIHGEQPAPDEDFSVCVTDYALKEALRLAPSSAKLKTCLIEVSEKEVRFKLMGKQRPVSFTIENEAWGWTYPNYTNVVPESAWVCARADHVSFDGKLLDPFLKAAQILSGGKQHILLRPNGDIGPISIRFQGSAADRFFGVLMPLHFSPLDPFVPGWVRPKKDPVQEPIAATQPQANP